MSFPRVFCAIIASAFFSFGPTVQAQLSKGHQILIDRGFQILGLTQPDNYFHLDTYTNAGYTTVAFSFDSTGNLGPISTFTGEPPGMPWARWAPNETNMPGTGTGQTGNGSTYSRTNEIPHLNQLVAVQLGDEWNLNDDATRNRLVNWFVAEHANWPGSILYHNNWGYQITDAALVDYITRAQPDMINFDTYPWESVWDVNAPNHIGPAIPGSGSFQLKQWYSELRQYREYARAFGIPMGIYRQIWHGVQDYDQHVYRDPSPSELRLNTFGAIAFSAKFLNDFYYNTSAGSMFTKIYNGSGDSQISTNGLYDEMADVNRCVRNWGNTLVRLTPISTEGIPGYTTSMMFIRGKDANGNLTPIPDGFLGDSEAGGANAGYTDWAFQRNDPYLRGWTVTNVAGVKNNGNPGEVIISWFKPLDESFDGPEFSNEIYMMVVNGLTDPTGSAADCAQEIQLNFSDTLSAVQMLDPLSGSVNAVTLSLTNGVRRLVLNLNGGDAALFKFADGAPFVGAQFSGPPVIGVQPANRTNVVGTSANFSVAASGTVPLHYQWQINGENIDGATASSFSKSNVQLADDGKSFTVVITNAEGSVTSAPAILSVIATLPPFFYEPFDYSNIGSPVSDNTPSNWTFGGGGANDLSVVNGSLTYPGLKESVGNSVTNGGAGLGVRRLLGTNVSSGVVYFSALFRINDLGYGTWNGASSIVGSLTAPNNSSFPLSVAVKSNSPSSFIIGVQKAASGGVVVFDSIEHHTNETVFLVGKYDFTTTPNIASLWINPSASSFGLVSEPGNAIFTTTGTDGLVIDRFNIRQNTAASVPAAMQWDELRVGNSWAEVTPLPTSFTTTLTDCVQLGDGQIQFNYTNSSGQNGSIYASTNLVDWNAVGAATQISPGVYQFIDSTATNHSRRFYQLRSP